MIGDWRPMRKRMPALKVPADARSRGRALAALLSDQLFALSNFQVFTPLQDLP